MRFVIPIFTAVALSAFLYLVILPLGKAIHDDGNFCSLLEFTRSSHHPIFTPEVMAQYEKSLVGWDGRWASLDLSGLWWDAFWPVMHSGEVAYAGAFIMPRYIAVWAGYFAAWFMVYCVIVLWFRRTDWPIFLLGGFAAIVSNTAVTTLRCLYPWDIASMCFIALGVFLFEESRTAIAKWHYLNWIWPVAIVGSFFRETVLVLTLLPFLNGAKYRWRWMAVAGVVFLVSRGLTCHLYIGDIHEGGGQAIWLQNLQRLFHFTADNPLFMDCGLVGMLWFLPMDWRLKFMAGVYVAAMFFMGEFNEYRDFFDVVPIGLLGLANYIRINQSPDGIGAATEMREVAA